MRFRSSGPPTISDFDDPPPRSLYIILLFQPIKLSDSNKKWYKNFVRLGDRPWCQKLKSEENPWLCFWGLGILGSEREIEGVQWLSEAPIWRERDWEAGFQRRERARVWCGSLRFSLSLRCFVVLRVCTFFFLLFYSFIYFSSLLAFYILFFYFLCLLF